MTAQIGLDADSLLCCKVKLGCLVTLHSFERVKLQTVLKFLILHPPKKKKTLGIYVMYGKSQNWVFFHLNFFRKMEISCYALIIVLLPFLGFCC